MIFLPATKEWKHVKGLFPRPVPSPLQNHWFFSEELQEKKCVQLPKHGSTRQWYELWNIISLSASKAPSVPQLFNHLAHSPLLPWDFSALTAPSPVYISWHYKNCLLLHSTNLHLLSQWFCYKPFVEHSRVSGLIQGRKETDHPACYLVSSSICVLPFISVCSEY